VTSGAGMILCR